MKKLIIASYFPLRLPDLILAEKVVPDRQLLIDAEQQANIFHSDAGPFQLDVDFVVYVQVPATGHLTLRWKADDTWWRKDWAYPHDDQSCNARNRKGGSCRVGSRITKNRSPCTPRR